VIATFSFSYIFGSKTDEKAADTLQKTEYRRLIM
jgi:hypothetical protein